MFRKPFVDVPQRILVLGATSAIAQEAIRLWAMPGARLYLIGRDRAKLDLVATDARTRGADVVVQAMADFGLMTDAAKTIGAVWQLWDGLDGALIAHGWLPTQAEAQDDPVAITECIRVNGTTACQWLALLAPLFAAQQQGWLAAISSVAADRGRAKMYVYGAAKALLSHTLEGMRQRLSPAGVRVVDLRPGPVRTPMTAGLTQLPLLVEASVAAQALVTACGAGTRGANGVVYIPGVWWPIMAILRHIPTPLWLKISI